MFSDMFKGRGGRWVFFRSPICHRLPFIAFPLSLSLFDYNRSTNRLHKVNLKSCLQSGPQMETLPMTTTREREREKLRIPIVPSLDIKEIMWVVLDRSKPVCILKRVVNRKRKLIRVKSVGLLLVEKGMLRVMARDML